MVGLAVLSGGLTVALGTPHSSISCSCAEHAAGGWPGQSMGTFLHTLWDRSKTTLNRTTASRNRPHRPPLDTLSSPTPRAGSSVLQGVLPIKWTKDIFWSKNEFYMSRKKNVLSVEWLNCNLIQSFRPAHPGGLGWIVPVNTWDEQKTSWPNIMKQPSVFPKPPLSALGAHP